ncbi:MAG: prolyl aminopeptidase [Proteobacteria bacterium]|nr:prolyl aminopeptidase [Pseudomonadota bacterium]
MTNSATLRELYPQLRPYQTGRLRVDDEHELYFEESGNPRGKAALFVHGGPGGGTNPRQRRFWDPRHYRIVLFDQRGCGRSQPHASLHNNTTWHLVADIERLREHLGIERWQVFGGSWGSTLALAYAQEHPSAVSELILRGVFLLRRHELHWFYQQGANHIYPDAWEAFVEPIPEPERDDLMRAYYRRLTCDDPVVRLRAARAWSIWEASTSSLVVVPDVLKDMAAENFALAFARIECHYFVNEGFLGSPNALIDNVDRIRHLPGVIVHGRYDVVCPMQAAWDLHRAWPEADFRICKRSGHSAFEPEIVHELVSATDRFRN